MFADQGGGLTGALQQLGPVAAGDRGRDGYASPAALCALAKLCEWAGDSLGAAARHGLCATAGAGRNPL